MTRSMDVQMNDAVCILANEWALLREKNLLNMY